MSATRPTNTIGPASFGRRTASSTRRCRPGCLAPALINALPLAWPQFAQRDDGPGAGARIGIAQEPRLAQVVGRIELGFGHIALANGVDAFKLISPAWPACFG
jgi:hypothetical protein